MVLTIIGYAVVLLTTVFFIAMAVVGAITDIEDDGKMTFSWVIILAACILTVSAVHLFPFTITLKG